MLDVTLEAKRPSSADGRLYRLTKTPSQPLIPNRVRIPPLLRTMSSCVLSVASPLSQEPVWICTCKSTLLRTRISLTPVTFALTAALRRSISPVTNSPTLGIGPTLVPSALREVGRKFTLKNTFSWLTTNINESTAFIFFYGEVYGFRTKSTAKSIH